MNGRIERMDARIERMDALEIVSEMNYQAIADEVENDQKRRIRRRIEGVIVLAALFGWLWLVIWKVAQGIR